MFGIGKSTRQEFTKNFISGSKYQVTKNYEIYSGKTKIGHVGQEGEVNITYQGNNPGIYFDISKLLYISHNAGKKIIVDDNLLTEIGKIGKGLEKVVCEIRDQ